MLANAQIVYDSPILRLSTILRLSCLDRVNAAGGAKVFIWRKVGPARRVTLPTL